MKEIPPPIVKSHSEMSVSQLSQKERPFWESLLDSPSSPVGEFYRLIAAIRVKSRLLAVQALGGELSA